VQLKFFAAFSASALDSKSAGVPLVFESPEHPVNEKDIEIMMVVKIYLRFFNFLG
tara:strand:+ start:286 stop:450 length:165 start_codon:yes stop_codon:yes gene_type:complete